MKVGSAMKPEIKSFETNFKIQKWIIILSSLMTVVFLLAIFGIVLNQLGIITSTLSIIKVALEPTPSIIYCNISTSNKSTQALESTISTSLIPAKKAFSDLKETLNVPENVFATLETFDYDSRKYAVNTKGCLVPNLDPHDPSTWGYIAKDHQAVRDQNKRLPLIATNNSAIFINSKTRDLYYNGSDVANCCWRTYWRSKIKDDRVIPNKDCRPFEESTSVHFDYINVQCWMRNNSVYNDYFAIIPYKPLVEKRSKKLAALYAPERKLSVLMIGKHATSRLGLRRFMPNTLNALRKIGAIEMHGYSKVSDSMYKNLVPLLTGLSDSQLDDFRLKNFNRTFDASPLLWKEFASRGYRTIFAEDNCTMSTFNNLKPGFRMQPTDYYLRPLCLAALPKIGETDKCFTNVCEGSRFMTDRLMEYTLAVATEFSHKPYFGFFWQINTNHGSEEEAHLDDEAYFKLLMNLFEYNLLQNTALVFLSDHGDQWKPFKWTYQGQLEERMPFAFISLPDWWKAQHPNAWKALKENTQRLTTPFDIHETLMDILDPSRIDAEDKSNEIPQTIKSPGVSLFTSISEDRSCDTAKISEDLCICHHRHEISRDSKKLTKLKDFLINEINNMIGEEPHCAKLEISSTINVEALENEENDIFNENKEKKYTVTIQTQPGNGIFRATIKYKDNDTMKLHGPIQRLDTYAQKSTCVNNFNLRFYCLCTKTD